MQNIKSIEKLETLIQFMTVVDDIIFIQSRDFSKVPYL